MGQERIETGRNSGLGRRKRKLIAISTQSTLVASLSSPFPFSSLSLTLQLLSHSAHRFHLSPTVSLNLTTISSDFTKFRRITVHFTSSVLLSNQHSRVMTRSEYEWRKNLSKRVGPRRVFREKGMFGNE